MLVFAAAAAPSVAPEAKEAGDVVVVIMLIISMGITRKAITKEILERG